MARTSRNRGSVSSARSLGVAVKFKKKVLEARSYAVNVWLLTCEPFAWGMSGNGKGKGEEGVVKAQSDRNLRASDRPWR